MSFLQDIVSLCRSRQTLTKTRQAFRSLRKFEMQPRYPQRPCELIRELRERGASRKGSGLEVRSLVRSVRSC